MTKSFANRIQALRAGNLHSQLTQMQRGLEKESLRVVPNGHLAQSPHPKALGSALTHNWITTDYSEALLEFITPVYQTIDAPLQFLDNLHRFTYQNLGQELLWVNSMPCILEDELSIPIAHYGTSNVGRMKHVYRHGLWHRYGRSMQTIAGIHYNLSFPDTFWSEYQEQLGDKAPLRDFISEQYLGLIRNFLRHVGLFVYLFGASPAVCASFLQGRSHHLKTLDEHTCFMPYGTSLRMSDLGYHNDAQAGLEVSYNSLVEYVQSLQHAIRTPYGPYEAIGVKTNGQYNQLNTNILQIENEFYSSIRPKRVTKSGERPTCALASRGIEYIEMRCIDLDPFTPGGITPEEIMFLDMFAVYCLLADSPPINKKEHQCNLKNLQTIVSEGRNPHLVLVTECDKPLAFRQWGINHLNSMLEIAALFDIAHDTGTYSAVIKAQLEKMEDASLTPSAKIMSQLQQEKQSFFEFAMGCAQQQGRHYLSESLPEKDLAQLTAAASESLLLQQEMEAESEIPFEEYLANFFGQDARLCS